MNTSRTSRFAVRLLLALSLCVIALGGQAASLRLDDIDSSFDVAGYLHQLRDPKSILTVEEAARATDWQALPAGVNDGFTGDAIWLRLQVDAVAHPHGGWILRFGNALLDQVSVYIQHPDGTWRLLGTSGEDIPRSEWPFEYRSAAFQLPETSGTQVLMIRLQSKNALASRIEVWPRLAFDNVTRRETLFYGLYFGFYLLLIGLHAVFWISTRAPMSGLFLAYIGIGVFNEALSLGLVQQLTHLSVQWSDRLLGAGIAINVLIAMAIASKLLELRKLYPRALNGFSILCTSVALLCAGLVIAGYYGTGMQIVQSMALLYMASFSVLGFYLWWRGWRPARFFILAFVTFYVCIFIAFLRNLGVLPVNYLTEHISTLCGMLHMMLLSFYIIGRHEKKRRAKEREQANLAANLARQHSFQLEGEVLSRTAELREEIQRRELLEAELRDALELERKVRAEQRDFVAMISHEFRTPLAIIGTSAQQLSRNLSASVEKNQARCGNIRNAAMRLLGLVDEYLSDDRMSEAPSVLRLAPCDLQDILTNLLAEFPQGRFAFAQKAAKEIVSDASLLRIALRNLLANADRYAPQHDVIQISMSEEKNFLYLDVANQGEYIEPVEQDRLFQKYYRGPNAQHRPGAGLGLYLVSRIAKQLGGAVRLIKAGGQDLVCFRLSLPFEPGDS